MQVLSGKRVSGSPPLAGSLASYPSEAGAAGGTDADSIDSADFQRHADDTKPTSTIGKTAFFTYLTQLLNFLEFSFITYLLKES